MGHWFRVRNASVGVECEREGSNLNCYANLSSTVELLEREVGQAENEARGLGHLRGGRRLAYRVELRAINDSKVSYKGFDQIGFDFCKDFLSEEDCRNWKQGTVPMVDLCAAEGDSIPSASNAPSNCDRTYLRGSLRKPLHRNKVGAWEAIWEFWEVQQAMTMETAEGEAATPDAVVAVSRDAVMEGDVDAVRRVGRITISFTVNEEDHFATAKNVVVVSGEGEEEDRRGEGAHDSSSSSSLPAAVESSMVMSVAVVTAGGNHTRVAEASTGDVAPQSDENEQTAEL